VFGYFTLHYTLLVVNEVEFWSSTYQCTNSTN